MISLTDSTIGLRAVEPGDIDLMYSWENDPAVWRVSNTVAPCSRHALERFVEQQQYGPIQSGEQRLMIQTCDGVTVGCIDLFEIDLLNSRAGVGILIHGEEHRRKGYSQKALHLLEEYSRDTLRLNQLWCNIAADNEASIRLFRSAGFGEVGIKRDWLWTPEGFTDEIMFQKILSQVSH